MIFLPFFFVFFLPTSDRFLFIWIPNSEIQRNISECFERCCILFPFFIVKFQCHWQTHVCDIVSENFNGQMCEFLPLEFTSCSDFNSKFSSIQQIFTLFFLLFSDFDSRFVLFFHSFFMCFKSAVVVAQVKRKIIGCINLSDARWWWWWWCFPSSRVSRVSCTDLSISFCFHLRLCLRLKSSSLTMFGLKLTFMFFCRRSVALCLRHRRRAVLLAAMLICVSYKLFFFIMIKIPFHTNKDRRCLNSSPSRRCRFIFFSNSSLMFSVF